MTSGGEGGPGRATAHVCSAAPQGGTGTPPSAGAAPDRSEGTGAPASGADADAPPVPHPRPREELHKLLDDLLDSADPDTGRVDADRFWTFAWALGLQRGIPEDLHEAGLEIMRQTQRADPEKPGPAADRARRAYHIGVLSALLRGGGEGDRPHEGRAADLLPGNFDHHAIHGDLLLMLAGELGEGDGQPQMLYCEGTSQEKHVRRAARQRLVLDVHWQAARARQSIRVTREAMLRRPATDEPIERDTWDGWNRAVPQEERQAAKAAGKRGEPWGSHPLSDRDRHMLLELATIMRSGRD